MRVDCIIMVYKPDKRLCHTVKRLLRQTVRPDNIYIMVTMDSEHSCRIIEERLQTVLGDVTAYETHVRCVPVLKSEFNHGGTRRYAASLSSADYILFMTQDAVPADSYLIRELMGSLENGNAAVAYARQLPYKNAGAVERFARGYNYPAEGRSQSLSNEEVLGIKTYFCSDVCAMYKKAAYDKLGGFNDRLNFNEDMIFAYKAVKAGYSVEYNSNAEVYHSHNFSLSEQFRRDYALAVSQKENADIFRDISSESEGIKYAKAGIRFFMGRGDIINTIRFIISCGVRYIGFFAGKRMGR